MKIRVLNQLGTKEVVFEVDQDGKNFEGVC
jgi:hypothetical protein